jgi:hypothetical protein
MKNTRSIFAFLIFSPFFFGSPVFAQESFQTAGRINILAGFGSGLHNVTNNDASQKNSAALTGGFILGVDYGLVPILTVGATVFTHRFATDKDSNEAARILAIGVYGNLNFWRRPKTTWYLQAGFGGSGFVYENFENDGKATSTGGYANIGLGFRRYFGDHIGVFVEAGAVGFNYNKFELSNGEVLKTASNNNYEIALSGFTLKAGITIALGENDD